MPRDFLTNRDGGDSLTSAPTFQPGGSNFAVPGSAWHNTGIGGAVGGAQNTTGSLIYMVIRAGVASDPDENGHIYLEIAPNNNGGVLPTTGWVTVDYIGFRNNQALTTGTPVANAGGGGALGAGRGLACFLPSLAWYRLRPFVVPTYNEPEWILDGSTPGFFQTIS